MSQDRDSWVNWAANITFGAARVHRPQTVAHVRELVAGAGRVGALGSRHSFNAIADTPGDLVSLERLDGVVALDPERGTVTVEAGIRYGVLCAALNNAGLAVHNTASLPHISVAGACATGTHGSGDRNGNLATAVSALELVTADGEVLALSRERDGERFRGAVVGLGALGVVTQLALDVQPAFQVQQDVYEGLPVERLEDSFDAITASGYSVSFFTDWQGDHVSQVWVKRRVGDTSAGGASMVGRAGTPSVAVGVVGAAAEAADFFGGRPATVKRHPIIALPAAACTEQLGVPGPWNERLPHFKMEFVPSSGAELQSEYFVERRHAVAAFRAIRSLGAAPAPVLQISEVRTVAADDLWLSGSYGRETVALHFTWYPDWPAVEALLPQLEERLAPFDARPHWGKLFTMAPARLRALYPRLPDFRSLAHELDPAGKFRNAFLDRYVFEEERGPS